MKNRLLFLFGVVGFSLLAYAVTEQRLKTEKLIIGSKTNSANKSLVFEKGDGTQPGFRFDQTKNKLQFAHDGTTFRDVGTGGGGGGGENFNNGFTADDNANAEDGTTGWTASAGTFGTDTSDPLEGEQSFTWIPAAQNDTLDSSELDVDKDIFKGRSCQASIEYVGGDNNLSLKVINADDEELATVQLLEHTISAVESVFFLCPSSADIAADADKGDLRLRIENTGVSPSALIKFDKAYLGTLIGLVETTLPDTCVGTINGTTGAITTSANCDFLSTVKNGAGDYSLNFTGLTSIPSCTVTPVQGWKVDLDVLSNTQCRVLVRGNAVITPTDSDFSFIVAKTGADAKQSVQVYKSIPKVAQNINHFSVTTSSAGAVLSENAEWINGNPVSGGTGIYDYNFSPGVFDQAPSCVATASVQGTVNCIIANVTATTMQSYCFNTNTNAALNREHYIHCEKQGVDYKLPTVQPVIVGQFSNSYSESSQKILRIETCEISNSGTPTTNQNLCDTWIDSITDDGVGEFTINITPGIFAETPNCWCIASFSTSCSFRGIVSSTQYSFRTREDDGTTIDISTRLFCMGVK